MSVYMVSLSTAAGREILDRLDEASAARGLRWTS
jgi:hypothetical protein